jgi:hypothetical protein
MRATANSYNVVKNLSKTLVLSIKREADTLVRKNQLIKKGGIFMKYLR